MMTTELISRGSFSNRGSKPITVEELLKMLQAQCKNDEKLLNTQIKIKVPRKGGFYEIKNISGVSTVLSSRDGKTPILLVEV